jgi:hypothetical protein
MTSKISKKVLVATILICFSAVVSEVNFSIFSFLLIVETFIDVCIPWDRFADSRNWRKFRLRLFKNQNQENKQNSQNGGKHNGKGFGWQQLHHGGTCLRETRKWVQKDALSATDETVLRVLGGRRHFLPWFGGEFWFTTKVSYWSKISFSDINVHFTSLFIIYQAGTYDIRGFSPSLEKVPTKIMPTGDYLSEAILYKGDQEVFRLKTYVSIIQI